ncbi:hypothetical protein BX666DRAFT_394209 [Dichotomocladium elegans]|nr:hypothetical protein BX666DRAFT_394209 [Dichotomocladium elegans]
MKKGHFNRANRSTKKAKPTKEDITANLPPQEKYEKFVEEAIQCEEQGERYGSGDRAERNYERAEVNYSKACGIIDNDPDGFYNWGRILYLLAGFNAKGDKHDLALERLELAIQKFRKSIELDDTKPDTFFNLGQALTLHAETALENGTQQMRWKAGPNLKEAIAVFEKTYELQEKELARMNKVDADQHDHAHHDEGTESNTKENADNQASTETDKFETVTEVEPTTIYSLIDTLVAMADTMTTLASQLSSFEGAVDLFSQARMKLAMAEKLLSSASETDKEYKTAMFEIGLKEAQNFSSQAERSYLATSKVDHTLFNQAIDRLDQILERDERHIAALCDRGDVLCSFADLIVDDSKRKANGLTGEAGKQAWSLYSQADKSFKAAATNDTNNSDIWNKLGDLSMMRAQLNGVPQSDSNKPQLLKNAQFYYSKSSKDKKNPYDRGALGVIYSTWALAHWCGEQKSARTAEDRMQMWMRLGADQDVFSDLTEDTNLYDEEFIGWATRHFGEASESESEEESS